MSMTSIYPIILFFVFIGVFSKYEVNFDKKILIYSLIIIFIYESISYFLLNKKDIFNIKSIFIFLALYYVIELLLNIAKEKAGGKNV